MAVIGTNYATLVDLHKGSAEGAIIELLKRLNPILDDAIAVECNDGAQHQTLTRTGLPSVAWGKLYQGIPQSKATLQSVTDTTGFVEAASTMDVRLLKLASDPARARLIDAQPFIEAMSNEAATGIFYHDQKTSPEKFTGLAARYNTVVQTGIGRQCVDAGGIGSDNTSIWFVNWGETTTRLIYPKGTKAGASMEDKGEQRTTDASGNPYYVKEAIWRWHLGLSLGDWRYNARICNIDVSDMQANTVDLWSFMRTAYYRLQSRRPGNGGVGKLAIYMNRDVMEILDKQSTDRAMISTNPNYTHMTRQNVEGAEVLFYRGIPIRETDALLNTEARVV